MAAFSNDVGNNAMTTLTRPSEPEVEQNGSNWMGRMASSQYRKKFFYTICLMLESFMAGWIYTQRSISLLDLQLITSTTMAKGSAIFTAAAAGSMIGCVTGGAIYDRFNKYLSLFVSMAGFGLIAAFIPLCHQYWLMIFMFVAQEFFSGIFKAGSSVELLRVWGVDGGPYMQALHFLWALGGIVSPFALEPFLASQNELCENVTHLNATMSSAEYHLIFNSSTNPNETYNLPSEVVNNTIYHVTHSESQIFWPFLVSGMVTVVCSVPFLVVYLFTRSDKHRGIEKQLTSKRQGRALSPKLLGLTLGLLGIFYFFLDEVEDSSFAFLPAYVVKQLNWSKMKSTRITSAFWGSYAFGRLAAIFFISYVSHVKICGIFFVLLVVSQVAMTISGYFLSEIGIWITTFAVGFSISISFPAMLTWIEKDFVQLSGKIMSVIFIAVGFGGMVNPVIIGPLMEEYTPLWYNYVLTIESVLLLLSFLMLVVLVKKVLRKFHEAQKEEEEVQVGICTEPTKNGIIRLDT